MYPDTMTKSDTIFIKWWKALVEECAKLGVADPGFLMALGYYEMGHTPAFAAREEAEYLVGDRSFA